jgi:hypothetical protein
VRPDGYIAARGEGADLVPLRTYIGMFLRVPEAVGGA